MNTSFDNDDHLIDHVVSWQDSDREVDSDDEYVGFDEDLPPLIADYLSDSEFEDTDSETDTDTAPDSELDLTLLQNVSGRLLSIPFCFCLCHPLTRKFLYLFAFLSYAQP